MLHSKFSDVLLIDEKGQNVGKISYENARERAFAAGLDLVEVHKQNGLSVYKIMDEGKWKYEQKKKQSKNKKHQIPEKEFKFRVKIDSHDQAIKIKHIKQLLQKGHKIRVAVQCGRYEVGDPMLIEQKRKELSEQLSEYKQEIITRRRDKEKNRNIRFEFYVLPQLIDKNN